VGGHIQARIHLLGFLQRLHPLGRIAVGHRREDAIREDLAHEQDLFARQMYLAFKDVLGISQKENRLAVARGYAALAEYRGTLRNRAKEVLEKLRLSDGVGVVLLGRPYHNDPGIMHGIASRIHKRGYPVFTVGSLPTDGAMEVSDVWKNSFSENTNLKLWAAKFVAGNPNLAAVDVSSFKCGLDSPIYSVVEKIIEAAGRPYFRFWEIDENESGGAVALRVETLDYLLRVYGERLRK